MLRQRSLYRGGTFMLNVVLSPIVHHEDARSLCHRRVSDFIISISSRVNIEAHVRCCGIVPLAEST